MVLNGLNALNGVKFPPTVWIKVHLIFEVVLIFEAVIIFEAVVIFKVIFIF